MSIVGDAGKNALVGFLSVIGFIILIVAFFLLMFWLSGFISWGKLIGTILNRILGG